MLLAKVIGSAVATQKTENLVGQKLLIVEPYRVDPQTRAALSTTGRSFVAVDALGAGRDELVLITQGSSARLTPETKNLPVDAVVVGIVDRVHVDQNCIYERRENR